MDKRCPGQNVILSVNKIKKGELIMTGTKTSTTSSETNGVKPHLLFEPERRLMEGADAQKMALRCTEYNDSRNEKRNFKCMEFNGVTFKDEDLSNMEAHYSKFTDCNFEECTICNAEFYFAEFSNCVFQNCNLRNSNFSFAEIFCVNFFNCNLNGVDFPFTRGNFSCTSCMMERSTASNSDLLLAFSDTNAYGFEANCSHLKFDVVRSNFRGAEFNDGSLQGKIAQTDMTNAELNRSDLTDLELTDCAVRGMETEEAVGFDDSEGNLSDIFGDNNE